jgi:flagellar biogenesis protein FliO
MGFARARAHCETPHMEIPKQQEQSAEERIGSMIGKFIVLALIAFFVWGYASTLAAKLGIF